MHSKIGEHVILSLNYLERKEMSAFLLIQYYFKCAFSLHINITNVTNATSAHTPNMIPSVKQFWQTLTTSEIHFCNEVHFPGTRPYKILEYN